MGNSASDIISRVNAASSEDMQKLLNQDIELLQDSSIVFASSKLTIRTDLNTYSVPGGEEKKEKKDAIKTDDEQSLMCSQDVLSSARERREQTINNLILEISRNIETDIASAEVTKRLQAFCRIFEAILRADELKKKKSKIEAKGENNELNLPATAKSAIKFGLSTLLCLVECVAAVNPQIYKLVVNDTNRILTEMGPLSMVASDSTLTQAFADIANFFEGVVSGNISTITQQESLFSFGPLFRLALSTGSLEFFSNFSHKLLGTSINSEFLNDLYPALKQFNALTTKNYYLKWNSKAKQEKVILSEDCLTANIEVGFSGNVFSEMEFGSDKYYVEITVKKLNSANFFGVCDSNFSNVSSWSDGSNFTACYKSDSEVYSKSNSLFKFEAWKENDRIGVFVDVVNKKLNFYCNGVKQSAEEISFVCARVKVYVFQTGPSEIVLNENPIYPADLKSIFLLKEVLVSEFEKKLERDGPSEEFLASNPGDLVNFIMKKFVDWTSPTEYLLLSKTFHFTQTKPVFGLDFSAKTIQSLYSLQALLLNLKASSNFALISEENLLNSLTSIQKLLRYHLILSYHLDDHSLDSALKLSILNSTVEIIRTFPESPQTEEASLIISSCFEVFYKEPSEKLTYILESLHRDAKKEEILPLFKDMQNEIYKEMSRADKVFPGLEITKEEDQGKVKEFYLLLIDLSAEASKRIINQEKIDSSVIKLLETTQAAILAQSGKALFKDAWKVILTEYSENFLEACIVVLEYLNEKYSSGSLPEEVLGSIQNTIVSRILEELLNGLVLSPMDLPLIADILPLITKISNELSKISAVPPSLSLGIGIIPELYESPHNYPDNAQLKHTIRVPGAIKYTLEFDPQCKTENGCDYLELWLDEAASNKFERWEGENFPKQPVEVINPLLHFTFRSDGSVNYWGWKINIKASVECSFYQKQWPDTTKDAAELFFGFCANKFISGKFEAVEISDDVKMVLENPLLKYGVSDKSTLVGKPLAEINKDLQKVIDTSLDPPVLNISKGLRDFVILRDYETGLHSYLSNYKTLENPKFSDSPFLQELFEGSERVTAAWTDLKKKFGFVGGSANIGGNDLDQAERAVFAVYTGYFEVIETMNHLFSNVKEAGPTLKIFIRQSTQIRAWAQKHKQKLMDRGNAEITYKIINDDVVKKCAILLGAEFKPSLKELGVNNVMKNLVSSIAKVQTSGLKVGSKWKSVQSAVKSMSKLKGLVSIKQKPREGDNEDTKEFMRVADLVTGLLENPVTLAQLTEALEIRRTRAIARVIGFYSISKLLSFSSNKHETFIVKSFINALKDKENKLYYSANLEGTDPKLLESVQKCFFIVYRSLLHDIITHHTSQFTYESFTHFLTVIESLSFPLKSHDTHMLVDLPLSALLKVLLDWSKGIIEEVPVKRTFLTENCITRFGLVTEDAVAEGKPKILIEKREGQPSLVLTFDKGGSDLPIIAFEVSEEIKEGWESAVDEFEVNGVKKWVLIKRSEPLPRLAFLTNVIEDFSPKFSPYNELLSKVNEEERKKIASLKESLSKSAWSLYKQLFFSIVGANVESNQTQQKEVQEFFLRTLMQEISVELQEESTKFDLKLLSTGETWVGKNLVAYENKTLMQTWLFKFINQSPPHELKEIVYGYVEHLDNLQQGISDQKSEIEAEWVEKSKDATGKYDFFKFIQNIKNTEDLPEICTNFIKTSGLWEEEYKNDYKNKYNMKEILASLEENLENAPESSFKVYFDLFKANNGIIAKEKLPENTPEGYKDSSGNSDLFVALNSIKTLDTSPELHSFFDIYPSLPQAVPEISTSKLAKHDYVASLLWVLYGGFTSPGLSSLLSNETYLLHLLNLAFTSNSYSLQTISSRIISKILPSQHSPQSFLHIWENFSKKLPQDNRASIVSLLLKKIGKSVWPGENFSQAYESLNLLSALISSERWKSEVFKILFEEIEDAIICIREGKLLRAEHVGAVKFFAVNDGFGVNPCVLSIVGLKNANFSTGVVKEVVDEKNYMVYSITDDTTVKVDVNDITSIKNSGSFSVLALPKEEVLVICKLFLKIWLAFDEAASKPFNVGYEGTVTMKAIYLGLETSILAGISNFIASVTLDPETLYEISAKLLKNTKKKTDITRVGYNKVLKEISKKLQELSDDPAEFTNEELQKKIEEMNEEDRNKINSFVEKGIGLAWVYKCWGKGFKEFDAISNYVEVVNPSQIYKLGPIEENQITVNDVHGTAEIFQNNLYHLVISDTTDSIKTAKFSVPNTIFHNQKYFISEVTLRFVLETHGNTAENEFGLSVGELRFKVSGKDLFINEEASGEINPELIIVRIHAESNGKVNIVVENTQIILEKISNNVFNGVSIGEVCLSSVKGNYVSLAFLEIYDGKITAPFAGKIEKGKKIDSGENFVKIKKKLENIEKIRLQLLGITDSQAEQSLSSSASFSEAVLYSLNHFSPSLTDEAFKIPDEIITEVKLVDTLDQVESGFHAVSAFENLEKVNLILPDTKIITFKKATPSKDIKGLVQFSVHENIGGETIGNLSAGDRPNPVFTKLSPVTEKDQPIRDIIFIKASSTYNVRVPLHYDIITDKEGKCINLAPKAESFYLFVAVTRTLKLLNTSVYLLEHVPSRGTSYGLIETKKNETSDKKDEAADYSVFSITELYSMLIDYENSRKLSNSNNLLTTILQSSPSLIPRLSSEFALSKLLNIVSPKVFASNPSLLSSSEFTEKLCAECISMLISSLISKTGGKALKTVTYESTHPYDNNMDFDDVIRIPGAKSLKIEFDPQCYTESGCDPLRFYENAGRVGEIRAFSGQGEANWPSIEIQGDTLYLYFHSDGSVNYWGYKFNVIPSGGGSDTEEVNCDAALDLLKVLAKQPSLSELIVSDKFLVPLYVFLISASTPEEKSKALDVIRSTFQGGFSEIHRKTIESLSKTANKLYKSTEHDKSSHSLLQSLVILLCEVQKYQNFQIVDPWFLDLSDLLSDMHGLTYKDLSLELFLFENYKSSSQSKLDRELESGHPYLISTTSTQLKIEGAHSLNIEFSKESKAEERHTVYFTSDPEGKHDIESSSALNTLSAKWDFKGPDIVVDQDDLRVTRTNSNSWGGVYSATKFSKGINSISFFIENTGGSGYLYIGLVESEEGGNYELASCLNRDNPRKLWVWRQSGEFHSKGSSINLQSFDTGDTITFIVNSSAKTILCLLNNIEVHTFYNIADTVSPAACFGGSNQFVVIKKVEAVGISSLESKRISVLGDCAYMWFPVNTSARLSYRWDYNNDEQSSVSLDKLTANQIGTNPTVFPTNLLISWGRHYWQVRIAKPGKLAVGLANNSVIVDKSTEKLGQFTYDSLGNIGEQQFEAYSAGDLIGCLVDIEANVVSFYKNNVLVHSVQGMLENTGYKFIGVLNEPEQSLTIVAGHPESIDLFTVNSDATSTEWGFKLKVSPEFKGRSHAAVNSYLMSSSEEFSKGWESYKLKFIEAFQSNAAEELVAYVDTLAASKGKEPTAFTVEEIDPVESELIYYPELEKLSKEDIKKLYVVLQNFNKRVENSLYLFDLSIGEHITDMQKVLFGSRGFIFFKLKNDLLKKALDKSKTEVRTEINIDRPKAARHRLKKEVDSEGLFSIFGQIYRAMASVDNKGYRNAERIYKINYRGEASIDAGGPYNESLSNICDELQSSFLRLLVPVQNNLHNMGENREAWILNPSATSEVDLELFNFLGKLMGASIRTQNNLNLSFPPLFWKKILHEPLSLKDLRGMDVCTVQILEILKNPSEHELTPDTFELAYDEKFTTQDSAGNVVELFEGGREKAVTFENCAEYADLVVKKRLEESQKAYHQIREGIKAVVPIDYLNLFSWKQLETLVCGTVDVDVDILKENTDYEGCGLSDQHIQFFWDILKEFSKKERSLFLKFVWGRSRLPSGKDWRHMKITRYNPNGPVNNFLPVSHTCFFTLDLPPYSTKDAMKQKLLYAVTHCTAIDLDGSAGAGWEEND